MKIGLLTYHKNFNYGWNLQCFALMSILKALGHEVMLIDKRRFQPISHKRRIKELLKSLLVTCHIISKRQSYEAIQLSKGRYVNSFFSKYILPRTKVITCKDGYLSLPKFDAFVVGSDQVWRSRLVYPIADYFFDFIHYPAKFLSYAASFGVDFPEYSDEEKKRCGSLIERFSAISVREQSGVNLIKDVYHWKCDPVVMPDPTLLLSQEEYINIIKNHKTNLPRIELFCYILDKTVGKDEVIKLLSDKYSLKPYVIYLNEKGCVPPVEEWLACFEKAKFIFTDSFHGSVFSIIFRKPFLAYGNTSRGLTRIASLLDSFGLQDRLITNSKDLAHLSFEKLEDIDSSKLEIVQESLKTKAIEFLSKNLQKP